MAIIAHAYHSSFIGGYCMVQAKYKSFFSGCEKASFSVLNTFVQEHIVGMNIVQIFNREEAEFKKV